MELAYSTHLVSGAVASDIGLSDMWLLSWQGQELLVSSSAHLAAAPVWSLPQTGPITRFEDVEIRGSFVPGVQSGMMVFELGAGALIAVTSSGEALWGGGLGMRNLVEVLDGPLGTVADGVQLAPNLWAMVEAGTGDLYTGTTDNPWAITIGDPVSAGAMAIAQGPTSAELGHIVVTADRAANAVISYGIGPDGAVTILDTAGAAAGLGLAEPTAITTIAAHGSHFAILGAAQSQSLSVVEIGQDGTLTPRDHILDTLHSRFGAVQAVTSVEAGGMPFVVAGGGDAGLSLFVLLPDGRLHHLDALPHAVGYGLEAITDIEAMVRGNALEIYVSSQREAGIAVLEVDLSDVGDLLSGTGTVTGTAGDDVLMALGEGDTLQGLGGDDVLVAGTATTLSGGAGADTFVFGAASDGSVVLDFQAGVDVLDLSAVPFVRNTGQLDVTQSGGATFVSFFDTTFEVRQIGGGALTAEQLFAAGFGNDADRMFYAPPSPPVVDPGDGAGGSDPANPTDPGDGGDPDNGGDPPPPPDTFVLREGVANPALVDTMVMLRADDGSETMITPDADGRFDLDLTQGETGTFDIMREYGGESGHFGVSDALDILRMTFGITPSFGEATSGHYKAADYNRDGSIGVADALDVLRMTFGLEASVDPEWRHFDATADWGDISAQSVPQTTGATFQMEDGPLELEMFAILSGDLDTVF